MISDLIVNEIIHAAQGGMNHTGFEPGSVLVLNFGKEFKFYEDFCIHLDEDDDCFLNVAVIDGPLSVAQNVETLRIAAKNVIPEIEKYGKPCLIVVCSAQRDEQVVEILKDYCGHIIFTKDSDDE